MISVPLIIMLEGSTAQYLPPPKQS